MGYVHVIQYDRRMGSAGPLASEFTSARYGGESGEFITISGKEVHDFGAFSLVATGKHPTVFPLCGSGT